MWHPDRQDQKRDRAEHTEAEAEMRPHTSVSVAAASDVGMRLGLPDPSVRRAIVAIAN
jgi:hypothetical protein